MKDPSCWNSFRVPNWQHSGSESRIRIGIVSPLATTTFHFCYKDELLTRRVERRRVMGEMRFGGSLICPISRNHLGGGESGSRDRNYQDKECGEMARLSLSVSVYRPNCASDKVQRQFSPRADKKIARCALPLHCSLHVKLRL